MRDAFLDSNYGAMTNILVTGATGTIGRETLRALEALGEKPRLALRDPSRAPDGRSAVALDWSDPATFGAALAGIERVFLLTPFVEDSETPARAFLEAAVHAKVKFVLKLSAAGVAEDAPFSAARQHARVERALAESGIGHAILRPTFFMDNVLTFQRDAILATGAFHGASGDQPVVYVSSRDVGEVAAQVLRAPAQHGGRTYELTGGVGVRDSELATLLASAAGKPVVYVDHSVEEYAASMTATGAPGWVAEAMSMLEAVKRNGWATTPSRAIDELLGRAPETYADFIARHAARLR